MVRRPASPLRPLATVIAVFATAGAAVGQEDSGERGTGSVLDLFAGSADDVLSNLGSLRFERRSLTKADPFTLLRDEMRKVNNQLDRAARIRIGFAWTALYQHATKAAGPEDAASADFDFFGRWRPLQTRETLGYLIFQTEGRYSMFTDITPNDLGLSIGSLWGTVNGYNEKHFNIKQIFWQQFLFDNRFSYRIGKVDQGSVLNTNRLQSDNLFFLNEAFSGNPTMAYPDNGFGMDLVWRPIRELYLACGISDAEGSFLNDRYDKSLKDASWFTAAEVGLTPWFDGLGAGVYRFTAWYTDARAEAMQPSSAGFTMSFDQDLGPSHIAFLRYGYTDGNLTNTKQIASGGLGFKRPLGPNDDFAGLAVAWGEPTDSTLRDQWVLEGFYRLQLTPAIQVTPDIQLILDPSDAPGEDAVWVFGVRTRITF